MGSIACVDVRDKSDLAIEQFVYNSVIFKGSYNHPFEVRRK